MAEMILTLNARSSSIKFAVFAIHEAESLPIQNYRGEIEGIGGQAHFFMYATAEQPGNLKTIRKPISASNHAKALMVTIQQNKARQGFRLKAENPVFLIDSFGNMPVAP